MMEAPSVTNATISSIDKPKSLILFVDNSRIVSAFCEIHTLTIPRLIKSALDV